MLQNQQYQQITTDRLADPKVFKDVKPFNKPIPYRHPRGAVKWVTLDASTSQEILRSINA